MFAILHFVKNYANLFCDIPVVVCVCVCVCVCVRARARVRVCACVFVRVYTRTLMRVFILYCLHMSLYCLQPKHRRFQSA